MIEQLYAGGLGMVAAGWWTALAWPVLWTLIKIIVVLAPLMGCVAYLTLWERKAIAFTQLRHWRSAASGANYPVAMRLKAGELEFELEPLMDDQELDSRASTGTIYWEGAVRAKREGRELGRGYLELTGYWKPLKL